MYISIAVLFEYSLNCVLVDVVLHKIYCWSILPTEMNAESSRSHLIIGVIIESTNLSTGTVIKGKLSLVDLAGSERAAKTGATAEQLKVK